MLQILRNAWKIPDLRRKLLYTLLILFLFRLGNWIPVPGVDVNALKGYAEGNTLFQMMGMISGSSMENFTLFALGISPYITASIIMQLLTVAIPSLGRMAKEDEDGRMKINKITRYVAVGLGLVESFGFTMKLMNDGKLYDRHWYTFAITTIIVTAGCMLVMWMGESISQRGVGNGISLLIFVGIVSRMPQYGSMLYSSWKDNVWMLAIIAAAFVALISIITWVDLGQRRIPVQYAKQQRGRKLYGGQTTHLPIKVNSASVLPIIFAMSFLSLPSIIGQFVGDSSRFAIFVKTYMSGTGPWAWAYVTVYMLLIFGFTFFYNSITVDPKEISKNLQQNGGFIQGIRPGKTTAEYIARVSGRLTFFCALFLMVVSIIPRLFTRQTPEMAAMSQLFTASSVLIMVNVALETAKQLESQMLVRNYRGFLG